MKKICSKCKEEKSLNNFTKNKAQIDGLQYFCKPCGLAYRKEWIAKNKDKQRCYGLRSNYGITLEEFNTIFNKQQKQCAICFTAEARGKTNEWNLDHCHDTGIIRGILCASCNFMLGNAYNKPQVLRNGATYLEGKEV